MNKENEGASIILALMYLLICSVLCIVILSSTAVYTARANERKQLDISNYLTISTLKLLASDIGNKVIEYEGDGEIYLERNLEIIGMESIAKPLAKMILDVLDGKELSEKEIEIDLENVDAKICSLLVLENDFSLALSIKRVYVDGEEIILPSSTGIKFYPLECRINAEEEKIYLKYGECIIE